MEINNAEPPKVTDYLDEDPIIDAQKYVCMSFMSWKNVKREDQFEKIFGGISPKLTELFGSYVTKKINVDDVSEMMVKLKCILHENRKLLDEREEKEKFQGGVKFRGAFPTIEEAEARAKLLSDNYDPNFHIFRGEGFKWVPFNPDPNMVDGQVYYEKELNDLMKTTKDELAEKKQTEEERKKKLRSEATEIQKTQKRENKVKERLQKKLMKRQMEKQEKPVEEPTRGTIVPPEANSAKAEFASHNETSKLIEEVAVDEKKLDQEKQNVSDLTDSLKKLQRAHEKLKQKAQENKKSTKM